MEILALIGSVLPMLIDFGAGLFKDRPNIERAILVGGGMAETGIESWARLSGIAEKIRSMPPGADFTDADLREMHEKRHANLEKFREMLAEKKADLSEAPIE